jgi:hypothetical protein
MTGRREGRIGRRKRGRAPSPDIGKQSSRGGGGRVTTDIETGGPAHHVFHKLPRLGRTI